MESNNIFTHIKTILQILNVGPPYLWDSSVYRILGHFEHRWEFHNSLQLLKPLKSQLRIHSLKWHLSSLCFGDSFIPSVFITVTKSSLVRRRKFLKTYSSFDGAHSIFKQFSSSYFSLRWRVGRKQNLRGRFLFYLFAVTIQAGAANSTFANHTLTVCHKANLLKSIVTCILLDWINALWLEINSGIASIKIIGISSSSSIEKQAPHKQSLQMFAVYKQCTAKLAAAKSDGTRTILNNCGQKDTVSQQMSVAIDGQSQESQWMPLSQ